MTLSRRIAAASLLAASSALPFAAFGQAKAAAPTTPAAPAAASKGGECSRVKLTTSLGAITVELDRAKAPVSAENFAKYAQSGHYNGTVFHRVIDGFMIQGGGFTKDMQQKPTAAPIKNEAANGLKNDAYTLAMARTGVRDSATSQFFINVVNNEMLNYRDETPGGWGYAVFGKVTDGKDVVDRIRKVPTANSGMHQNVPTQPVVLEKAECI
jgi:cyclophilin family peptidyl-prolyl cis-trans isomerase